MPNPNKTRRLWLEVLFKVPAGTPKETVRQTMIDAISSGSYKLPEGWNAVIKWRNKEGAQMRVGEWNAVLIASSRSSSGFDRAVISYLERM